jgi:GntR family transcriptional regulator, rspAB operon transcriptional repressor
MVEAGTITIEIAERGKNQPIHQWVYQVLRTNIIELHIPPAQQISENEISDRLGISRTPVREAFIRLAEDGLLKITPQKKTIVSLIDLEQAEEARFIRRAMEKAVLSEVCGKLPDDARADLEANLGAQEECLRDNTYDRMLIVDNDFHRVIFRSCGKERSWLFVKKLDFNYDRLRIMTIPHTIDHVIEEHRAILRILLAGQRDRIDGIVESHLTWTEIAKSLNEFPPQYFEQDLQPGSGDRTDGAADARGNSR